ncbi:MAG: Gfo/Idh/MocA family oxidoreductase [Clostridiales bacterium]|nr:Gfo/Idh/MocA family oxidoreductase [Clostridiales bacterium]
MKIGIIGCGNIAPYWVKAARTLSIDIAAVCDRNEKALKNYKEYQGFTDVDEMLAGGFPMDAVVIATNPSSHADVAYRTMAAGLPTIIEKPLAEKREDVTGLADFSRNRNVFLGAAFHAARAPEVLWFREHRDELEKGLSVLRGFECTFLDPNASEDGIAVRARGLHGSYLDSGVNALSVLEGLFGIRRFRCLNFSPSLLESTTVASNTVYTNGNICGNIITDWTQDRNYKCTRLYYEKGVIVLNHSERELSVVTADSRKTIPLADPARTRMEEQYVLVLSEMRERLRTGQSNLKEALDIHAVLFDSDLS